MVYFLSDLKEVDKPYKITGFILFFDQKNQGLFKDVQGHIFHFSRTPFTAKKSLESKSFLVLPQHEQCYPKGLSVFAG